MSIAYNNGVSVSDLQNSNPDLDGDLIRPEISLRLGSRKATDSHNYEKVKYSKEIPMKANDSSLKR